MDQIVCLQDIEDYASKVLPRNALDFYRCGAGAEESLKNNRNSYFRYRIRPKVLQNVAVRDLSITVQGKTISMPIGISPTAMQKMAHPDGECASARAAQEMGTIFILSTISTCTIEEVAAAAPSAIKWFQVYANKNRNITKELIKRAEKAGFEALVLTVDVPVIATRRESIRNKFSLPSHLTLVNFHEGQTVNQSFIDESIDSSLEWNDIKWFQSITKLPIIIKGILTEEDATRAVNMNVAGIFVSNHGGRQIDTSVSPVEALPEIVKAVGTKVEIYLDGGIREGIDVFKTLALGAKMVFVGRPVLWGLAYAGEEGVKTMLSLLRREFDETLALTGCTSVESIERNMVVHESYFSHL